MSAPPAARKSLSPRADPGYVQPERASEREEDPMAVEEATSLTEQDVDAFNRGDWETTRRLYAPDAVYDEIPTGRRLEGTEEMIEGLQGWHEAFPDARGTITNSFSVGDQVVQEVTWEGTQSGELETPQGPIPASGRWVSVRAVQLFRCEDGQITENRHYFDMLGMLQQIGAMEG
jgi:steroid delta-isomerase-like uncharacterized protein